jgi:hypothetical protein
MKVGNKIKQLKKEHKVTRKEISKTIKAIEESNNGNLSRIKKIFLFFGFDTEIVLKKK